MVTKEIHEIHFNWHQTVWDGSAGEDYSLHKVGEKGVISIKEHPKTINTPQWVYVVKFDDNSEEIIYNPNRVFKREIKKEK